MTAHRLLAVLVLTGTLGLSACGADTPAASEPSRPDTATTTRAGASDTTAPVAPVQIVGHFEGVEFYPACGNETLNHQGATWYTLANVAYGSVDPAFQERAEAVLAVDREASPVMGRQGLLRVVDPGPGDDIGTLVVWSDGVARWVSDSGDLDVWLIDDELTYNWVC